MNDRYPVPDFLRQPKPFVRAPIERPILFSAPMVRAMLAGAKTQTRRLYKNRKHPDFGCDMAGCELAREQQHVIDRICPYGRPGDRLWVREAWAQPTTLDPGPTLYRADYPACVPPHFENVPPADQVKWKPSIHMRRADSRILLEITAVRVERLNEISEADALAEGVIEGTGDFAGCFSVPSTQAMSGTTAKECYARLWDDINGAGSWAANPWVWCVSFRRIA